MASELSEAEQRLIAELCAGYRIWAPEAGGTPRVSERLNGGHSNLSLRLSARHGDWVLRLARGEAPPGVCRRREEAAHRAAAAAGIAPPLLFCDPRQGVLITQYIADDDPGAHGIVQLASLLQRIHRLPPAGDAPDLGADLVACRRQIEEHVPRSPLPALLKRHARTIDSALAHSAPCAEQPAALCHNDPLRANRLGHRGRLLAIDWEYARTGDPFFDLAACASQLSPAEGTELLRRYLGRAPARAETQRMRDQELLYACIEACWYCLYSADGRARDAAHARLAARLNAA